MGYYRIPKVHVLGHDYTNVKFSRAASKCSEATQIQCDFESINGAISMCSQIQLSDCKLCD